MADWAIVSGILNGYPHNPEIYAGLYDRPIPFYFLQSHDLLAWKQKTAVLTGYPHVVYLDLTPKPTFNSIELSHATGLFGMADDLAVTVKSITNTAIEDILTFKVIDSTDTVKLQETITISEDGAIPSLTHTFTASDISTLPVGIYCVYVSISREDTVGKEDSVSFQVKTPPDWAINSGILAGYPHNPFIDAALYDRPIPFYFIYSHDELAWKLINDVLSGYPHVVYWDTTPPTPPVTLPTFDSIGLNRTIGFVGVSGGLTVTVYAIENAESGDVLTFEILDAAQTVRLQDTITLSQAGSIASETHTFTSTDMDTLPTGTYSVSVSISRDADMGKESSVTYMVKSKPYITVNSVTPSQLQKPIIAGQQITIVYTITVDSSITAAQSTFLLAGYTVTHSASGNILGSQTAYLQIDDNISAGQYNLTVSSTLTITGYGALQITHTIGNVLEIIAAPTPVDPGFTGLALSATGRYVGNEINIQVTVSGMTNILIGDTMTVSLKQGNTVIYTNTEPLTAGAYYYTHTIPQSAFIGLSVGVYTVSAQISRGSFSVQKQTEYSVIGPPTLTLASVTPNIVHLPITTPFSLTSAWQVSGTCVDNVAGTVTLANMGFGVSVNTAQMGFNAVIPGITGLAVGNYAMDSALTATSYEYGSVNLFGTFPNALSVLPELPPTPELPKDLRAGNVYLYNGFELTAIIKSYVSFKWVRRYNKVGEFMLQLEKTRANIDLLSTGNIIMKENDDEAGFIEDINITEYIEVSGRFVSSLLDYRIVTHISESKVSLQAAVKQIIQDNFINSAATDRVIPELAIDTNSISDQQVTVNIDNNTLTPWLEGQRIGFKIRFDPAAHKFWFKLYEGKNSDAVFMENYRNIVEEQYFLQTSEYKNVVYVRSGSGDTGQTVSIGSAQGLNRREGYLTAGSYAADEIGPRFLEDNGPKETLDVKIVDPYTPFEYKKDYDIGDVVKVISTQYAVEMAEHILEITEYFDLTGFHLYIVFGDLPRTILTEIKDNSRSVDNIMNSRNDWLDSVMPDIVDQVLDDVLENLPDLPIGEVLEDLIDEKILDTLTDMPEPVQDAITDLIETVTPDVVQNVLSDMGIGENGNHIILDHLPTQSEIDTFMAGAVVLVYDPNSPYEPEE